MHKTRMITEGALMLAFFSVLLMITLYVPFLWYISMLFIVLPFVLYSAKYPIKYSLLVFIGSIILSTIIGSIFAASIALAFGSTGIVMGWMIKEKKDKSILFISASFTLLLNLVGQYIISIVFMEINIIEETIEEMKKTFDMAVNMINNSGQTIDGKLIRDFKAAFDLIEALIPTTFLFSSVLTVLILMLVNFPIIKRLGIETPKFKPFREWQLPKSIIWYYLIFLLISIIFRPEAGSYFYIATINVMYVLQILIALQGYAFLYYLSYIKGVPKPLVVFLTIVSLPFLHFIGILGIIDLGFDLRRRIQQK